MGVKEQFKNLFVSSVLKPEIFGDAKAMGHLKIIYFLLAILAIL